MENSTIYYYDFNLKCFIKEDFAGYDPEEPDRLLVPFCATIIPPPEYTSNHIPVIDDIYEPKEWSVIEDYRGETVYNKYTRIDSIIDYLGPVSADSTIIKPPEPFYHMWSDIESNWVEDVILKRQYNLNQLDLHYSFILGNLKESWSGAMMNEFTELEQEIKKEYQKILKEYTLKKEEIENDILPAFNIESNFKYCILCGTKLIVHENYLSCPTCKWSTPFEGDK